MRVVQNKSQKQEWSQKVGNNKNKMINGVSIKTRIEEASST